MAKRKTKRKAPRRYSKSVSLLNIAEGILLANVATRATVGLSAWDFLSDGWNASAPAKAQGPGQLSLHEIIYGNKVNMPVVKTAQGTMGGLMTSTATNTELVVENLKANWVPALVQSIAIPIGFKFARRMLRKPISMGNKVLTATNMRSQVRI